MALQALVHVPCNLLCDHQPRKRTSYILVACTSRAMSLAMQADIWRHKVPTHACTALT